ncbi:MAG: phosphate signaling complex protein PhoU [Deltaproteobacteria bacterium]|nr:phosphate signaling complex protein PhoU [Deltaproteobacteria bacterium]
MSVHLQKEIEKLKKLIITEGTVVEESVTNAVSSIEKRDANLAQQVIKMDDKIDQLEVNLEEEGLKILALHQPVAIDLRFIAAVLKINNDLERIGDLSVNIAERAIFLASRPPIDVPFDFKTMTANVRMMLTHSLDALVKLDTQMAKDVCASDDIVDEINRKMYGQVSEGIRKHPERLECLIHFLLVSRHLERIADLATNIAEDVIYMIDGKVVRHKVEDYVATSSH